MGISAVALVACAGLAQLSSAATGDLTAQACFAETTAEGCSVPTDPALGSARGVTVSPNGRFVYVAAGGDDSISSFSRDAAGTLTYRDCFAETNADGCSVPSAAALNDPHAAAASADGESVYVVSDDSDSLSRFLLTANGNLAFHSCLAVTNAEGCTVPNEGQALGAPNDVAVSPDDQNVYVAASGSDAIVWFTQSPGGALGGHQGCIEDTNLSSCPQTGTLEGAQGVAVSPDGRSVYVAAGTDGLNNFARVPDGDLDFQHCFAETNAAGCLVPAQAALQGARDVAVSPDGGSVYVVSSISNSISHFGRASDGDLTFRNCVAATTAEGCAARASINQPRSVAVSGDGNSVYVASSNTDSVSHFARAANGNLSFRSCLAETATAGCTVPSPAALNEPTGVAASADGRSVYVAAEDSGLSHFLRELPPAPPAPVRCAGRAATRFGTSAGEALRGTGAADVIAGLGGNDVIRGLGGNDVLCGARGRDRLLGGRGRDRLLGQAGRDVLRGGPGRDVLRGGPGRDVLRGGPGRDRQRQ